MVRPSQIGRPDQDAFAICRVGPSLICAAARVQRTDPADTAHRVIRSIGKIAIMANGRLG